MKKLTLCSSVALISALAGMHTAAQTVIPPSTKVSPDTSKPGFLWRVFLNPADQSNTSARAQAALSGALRDAEGNLLPNLADPNAQGVALATVPAPNPENAFLQFDIAGSINLNQSEGGGAGNFPEDGQMPGVPGTDGSSDGISVDMITYIELPVGVVTMGVNSDDGFVTRAGDLLDAFRGITLGGYEGGRGSSDTLFTFTVTEAGVYPFKTTYYEGGGDANVEWFTVNGDVKTLVNDTANGGFKAYRAVANAAPHDPYIKSVAPAPAPRQVNQVFASVTVVLNDGDNVAIDDSTIDLKIDGVPVTTKVRSGKTVTLTYTPTTIQFPSESHTASLTFKGAGGFTRTENWTFRNLKNVILPQPVLTEDFNSYAEGTLPTDWVATNFTAQCDDESNPENQRSNTYMNWAVISTDTMPMIDDAGINEVNQTEKVNGVPLTLEMLRSGMVIYAESDSRCNGDARQEVIDGNLPGPHGQTQFIVSKPFNLSAVKDPVLSFGSGYMQNQDSYGGLEYSVDGGTTFLPIVIYLDEADITVAADGTTDGVTTLTRIQGDTSVWVENGVVKGQAYGDALKAPINASIGNYIAPRVNDNGTEGKRVEIFRLPAAANKSDVRLRFSATGTDSWYWYVDNIKFYDIPSTTTPTVSVLSSSTLNGAFTADTTATAVGTDKFVVPISGNAKYFRIDGASTIKSVTQDGNNVVLTY